MAAVAITPCLERRVGAAGGALGPAVSELPREQDDDREERQCCCHADACVPRDTGAEPQPGGRPRARRQVRPRLGHEQRLGLEPPRRPARRRPSDIKARTARKLHELDDNMVRAGRQRDGCRVRLESCLLVALDHEAAVDQNAHGIIGAGVDVVSARRRRQPDARPPDRHETGFNVLALVEHGEIDRGRWALQHLTAGEFLGVVDGLHEADGALQSGPCGARRARQADRSNEQREGNEESEENDPATEHSLSSRSTQGMSTADQTRSSEKCVVRVALTSDPAVVIKGSSVAALTGLAWHRIARDADGHCRNLPPRRRTRNHADVPPRLRPSGRGRSPPPMGLAVSPQPELPAGRAADLGGARGSHGDRPVRHDARAARGERPGDCAPRGAWT